MKNNIYSIITSSGRYIPSHVVKNEDFLNNTFYNSSGERNHKTNDEIITKFQQITEIEERRYVEDDYVASDIGYFAALDALNTAKIDKETLDYIIVAHNFGDVLKSNRRTDMVPSLASRIKYKLGIKNPDTIAYDLPFGCPGWLQAVIQADYYIKSGDAKKILVIGTETLSRISDPHDIDSMIYADGAGAVIIEGIYSDLPIGIMKHKTRSDTLDHAHLLRMGVTYDPTSDDDTLYLKMDGRKLYEYALTHVAPAIKACLDSAELSIIDIKKVLIHQANAKMDHAILTRLLKLYHIKDIPDGLMPMTIAKLGNNSVATLPILYDVIMKGELENHSMNKEDNIVFASVGAGMNVNALVYKIP